ncbi:MAG: ATP-binding cassette domain-containing protein [Piscirickettsiaceae bacterium]|nr:ATP-binding cassette domain-containing protein [Piscirickettsiaceae bacterium]
MTSSAYQLSKIKVFREQRCVLDIPELNLPKNQCISLLGDNGAGKSTLLELLAFVSKPSEGQIKLVGQEIGNDLTPSQRQSIAYVAQHPYLLSGSVFDNIQLALTLQGIKAKHHPRLIKQALEHVNSGQLIEQQVNTLSGGELKRVAIARAISYEPDILLLDEPFSHLDQTHFQQLETILQQLSQQENKTIIFSTHNRFQGLALAESSINLVEGKLTSNPLVNIFHGHLSNELFDTGKLKIHTNNQSNQARHIAINPSEIIISSQELQSSMRNKFLGRLILIAEEGIAIRLSIDCGELFQVIISPDALSELNLSIGNKLWLSFKSTAVNVF